MKLFFASDIHGSASAMNKILSMVDRENPDQMVLLGDLLYHGPRNHFPDQYDTFAVTKLLNGSRLTPFCVRGNCDAEVDQMVLNFPMMADYLLLPLKDDRTAFVTHGHLFNRDNPPPHKTGDVLIHGHTHVHGFFPAGDFTCINPGSAALPKENQVPSYMIYENGLFSIRELDTGKEIVSWELP